MLARNCAAKLNVELSILLVRDHSNFSGNFPICVIFLFLLIAHKTKTPSQIAHNNKKKLKISKKKKERNQTCKT